MNRLESGSYPELTLLGNVSEIDVETLESELATILVEGEEIQHAYKLFRDRLVFSSKRLVQVDQQGFTGKKKSYLSIPDSSITKFSKEGKGSLDADAEIKVWLRGEAMPTEFRFRDDRNVDDVYQVLSSYILK